MTRFPTFDNEISREAACTGGLSPKRCCVSVHDLEIGMFVDELDKPWIESGFLLQGFFIESTEQIQQLREECAVVYVNQASIPAAIKHRSANRGPWRVISGGLGGS